MPAAPVLTSYLDIKVNGTSLSEAVQGVLVDCEVESTYNRQDICLLAFNIDANTEIPAAIEIGKPIEVIVKGQQETAGTPIFTGEITALEFDAMEGLSVFTVQAEDKFHRLFRIDKVRTFVDSTVSDAVSKIAREAGLNGGGITATTSKIPFQMQQGVSDAVWILDRAAELGFHVSVDGDKLFFGKVGSGGDSGVVLEQGKNLVSFTCRVSANAYLKEVGVRGWDPMKKEAIVGKATSYAGEKDPKVASAFGTSPTMLLPRTEVGNPGDANKTAQAALDRANEQQRQADGVCYGNAKIVVDKELKIDGVNARFNGKYTVSHVRHRYSADSGFMTEFSCRGAANQSLPALVIETATANGGGPRDRSPFEGAMVGIVTDTKDPNEWGRVKVKLPWLDDQQTTDWLRVAFPGGGGNADSHHGWYLIPEVNDEVLVLFEHGDARRGYVLGGLQNGKDKPFYKNDKVLENGKVNQHAFRLKNGTHLLFDEKANEELIELKNKDGKFVFKWSAKDGVVLENKTSGDKMAITNKGNMTIVCETGDITIEAKQGGINLKAMKDVKIDATGKVAVKATQDATVDGLNVKVNAQASAEVKGTATAKLEASGQTTVKGAMVMIN